MKYIRTVKIVTPVILACGALATVAFTGSAHNDQSGSNSGAPAPLKSATNVTSAPNVTVTINGDSKAVPQGVSQFQAGKATVMVSNTGSGVATQVHDSTGNSSVTSTDNGHVNISVTTNSVQQEGHGSTSVNASGFSESSSQQFSSVQSSSSGTQPTP